MKTIESEIFEAFDKECASDDLKMRTLQMLREQTEETSRPTPQSIGNGKPSHKTKYFRQHLLSLVAACLCLVLVGAGGYKVYASETAFVSIDVNPSIELGLNCFDRVISVRAFNEDGEEIIEHNDVLNKTYETAVTMILGSDAIAPYINEDSILSVVVVANRNAQEEKLLNASSACLERARFSWECSAESSQVREEALRNNLSTGKYRVFLQLQKLGSPITIDECRDLTMRELNDLLLGYGILSGSGSGQGANIDGEPGDGQATGSAGGDSSGQGSDTESGNGAGATGGDSTGSYGSSSGTGSGAGSGPSSTGTKGQGSS